jgi:hypothetical protein
MVRRLLQEVDSCGKWLGDMIKEKDRLFLSDGWGDLLLFLTDEGRNGSKLDDAEQKREARDRGLKEVFYIQSRLFEDFMVDRTEIFLSGRCIETAAESDKFHLSIEFRLMEGRTIGQANKRVEELITKNLEDGFWAKGKDCNEDDKEGKARKCRVRVCRIPGRTDFHVSLTATVKGLTIDRLCQLFKDIPLDTVETTIGLKIPDY